MVPGLSGQFFSFFILPSPFLSVQAADSHAHILEYGAARQLALEGAKSIAGRAFRVDNP